MANGVPEACRPIEERCRSIELEIEGLEAELDACLEAGAPAGDIQAPPPSMSHDNATPTGGPEPP